MSYLALPPPPVPTVQRNPNYLENKGMSRHPDCNCNCLQKDSQVFQGLSGQNGHCTCTCHPGQKGQPPLISPTLPILQVSEDKVFHVQKEERGAGHSDPELGAVEERMDMFEWMARQRLKDVHQKRESITHEYKTREPLKPEVLHHHQLKTTAENQPNPPLPVQTSESRNYLKAIQIVQNMRAKWESITSARNPPLIPLQNKATGGHFVKPADFFTGIFRKSEYQGQISKRSYTQDNQKQVDESESRWKRPMRPSTKTHDQHQDQNKGIKTIPKVDKISQVDILEVQKPPPPETTPPITTPEKKVEKPYRTNAQVQTTPRLCMETTENGKISLKCTRHIITKPEVLSPPPPPEEIDTRTEFQQITLKKHKHGKSSYHQQRHSSLTYDPRIRHTLLPNNKVSVEGLIPITSFNPSSPPLPDPIVDTPSEQSLSSSCSCSDDEEQIKEENGKIVEINEEKTHWYSGWFSKEEVTPPGPLTLEQEQHYSAGEEKYQTTEEIQSARSSTASVPWSTSSIALEVQGNQPRRATITNDDLLLLDLSADFNDTILEELDSQVLTIRKSKSKTNLTLDELQEVAKSLSQERLLSRSPSAKRLLGSRLANENQSNFERDFHICHKCKKIVKPGDAMFQFQNGRQNVWHRQCFVCTKCNKQLGIMDHLFYENEPYCYEDYVVIAHVPRCHGCHELIFDTSYTSAAGYFWHKDHFVCDKCHRPLVDTKYVAVEGRPYCFTCHQKDFVKVCKYCGKTILPHEPYVQSGDYYWHSNDSCLHCGTCQRSLVGRSVFFRKSGNLYCNRYCALGRAPST